jgi:hypothetical protein
MTEGKAKSASVSRWQVLASGQQKDDGIARCPQGHIHLDYGNLSLRFDQQAFIAFGEMVGDALVALTGESNFILGPAPHHADATFSES